MSANPKIVLLFFVVLYLTKSLDCRNIRANRTDNKPVSEFFGADLEYKCKDNGDGEF